MSGGTVYDEYKDVHQIHDRKLDALEDLIEAVKARMENLKKMQYQSFHILCTHSF